MMYHILSLHHNTYLLEPTDHFTPQAVAVAGHHSDVERTAEQRKVIHVVRVEIQ